MPINWSKVTVTLVDDRFVDKSHKDSNEKLVFEELMINNAKDINFISLCNSPEEVLNINRSFDIMLLGMGEDGHFASLFPSMIQTKPNYFDPLCKPEIIYTEPMGDPKHKRVTMNLSMILKSKKIILLVSNQKKLDLINKARTNRNLPIHFLLNQKEVDVDIFQLFS
jgi:6-phosphogluconolactonase